MHRLESKAISIQEHTLSNHYGTIPLIRHCLEARWGGGGGGGWGGGGGGGAVAEGAFAPSRGCFPPPPPFQPNYITSPITRAKSQNNVMHILP